MAIPLLQNQGPVAQSRPIVPLASASSVRLARSNAVMATSSVINEPLQMLDLARSQAQQGAAIGGAIAQAGGMLEQIALKRLEAKNYADMAEAETEAQGAMAKHLEWRMRNPNPETWAANFEETFAKTRSAIEGRGFAPLVREKLKISLDSLAMKGRIDVGLAATKTEIDRSVSAASAKFSMGVDSGNMETVDAALADFGTLTGAPPEVLQEKRAVAMKQIEGKADKKRFDDLLLFIDNDPREGAALIEAHNRTRPFSSAEMLDLQRATETSTNRKRGADNGAVKALWKAGQVKTPEDLEAFPYLSDEDRLDWKEQLTKPVLNDSAEYERTLGRIARYKAADDPTGQGIAELRTTILKRFDTGYEETLKEKLDAKIKPTAQDLPNDVARAWLDEQVFDKNGLGAWKMEKKDEAGKPVLKKREASYSQSIEDGWFSAPKTVTTKREDVFEPEMVEDPVKKAALAEKVKAIMAEVDRATKAGEVKTTGEAKALMLKLYVKAGGALPAEAPGPDASLFPEGSMNAALEAMKKYAK